MASPVDRTMTPEPMIRVQHLTKRYKKSAVAAVDDGLTSARRALRLLGPNGAGKTTTIRS
jgi:ABC-type multidrug transport system ATPase subunit